MPFIPHTEQDVRAMLETIGVDSIEALFDEVPAELRADGIDGISEGLSEMAVTRLMHQRAAMDPMDSCFIGAGAYEHHVPAAVWQLATRGEYYSAYTPYQAEASQGTLQLIYEYQTMMASLMAMEVSNASLYDGASALGEAALMAVRTNRRSRSKRILVAGGLHPHYRQVAQTIVGNQGIRFEDLPFDQRGGHVDPDSLERFSGEDLTALVIAQPNFFGVLEEVDALTDWAHRQGALVIAVVNPIAMSVLAAPGEWGESGADIVCGDGQPLGVPLSGGGPYYGFMCCKQAHIRQMPGRLVGRTVDLEGRPGYTLTLQPREQHIRRSKATSNICTNQGLAVTASTIYMAMLGAEGLARVAAASHHNTDALIRGLTGIAGVETVFDRPFFHEAVVRLPCKADGVLSALEAHGIIGGLPLARYFPAMDDCILVCATETKTEEDIAHYVAVMQGVLAAAGSGSQAIERTATDSGLSR